MRLEPPSLIGRWIDRLFPCILPRIAVAPVKACVPVCEPVQSCLPPRISYWEYLERQNIRDADISYGLPTGTGRFTPAVPMVDYPSIETRICDKPSVGLGGPSLGFVPQPQNDQAPPQRAPQRTMRISEPGVMGTVMDIIA